MIMAVSILKKTCDLAETLGTQRKNKNLARLINPNKPLRALRLCESIIPVELQKCY
jgi:hypothetical protein